MLSTLCIATYYIDMLIKFTCYPDRLTECTDWSGMLWMG